MNFQTEGKKFPSTRIKREEEEEEEKLEICIKFISCRLLDRFEGNKSLRDACRDSRFE